MAAIQPVDRSPGSSQMDCQDVGFRNRIETKIQALQYGQRASENCALTTVLNVLLKEQLSTLQVIKLLAKNV